MLLKEAGVSDCAIHLDERDVPERTKDRKSDPMS